MQPIETPLVFSGFSAEAIKLWQDHLPASGLTATSGMGGGSSTQPQPDPIVPGSAISAVLVRGDLDISATCTVTYVDAKQLLACGHPITQYGPVSMPMTKAEVLATLASPLNAFKIINTTETVGSFTQDRQSAIGGLLGTTARMIPVSVSISREAPGSHEASGTDATSGRNSAPRKLHFEVVDNPQITPVAVMVSIYQALLENNAYAQESSYRMSAAIELDGYPSVHLDSLVAPTDQAPASLQAAVMVGRNFAQLYDNAARLTNVRSVHVEFEAIPGRQSLQLESVTSSATRVHPGDSITIEATVRPYHGEPHNIRIPITLPASLTEGTLRSGGQRWRHPRSHYPKLPGHWASARYRGEHRADEQFARQRPTLCHAARVGGASGARWTHPGRAAHLDGQRLRAFTQQSGDDFEWRIGRSRRIGRRRRDAIWPASDLAPGGIAAGVFRRHEGNGTV